MPPPGGTRTSLSGYTVQVSYASTFGQAGLFSPGNPPDPTNGQQPTRHFDFAVGSNLIYRPRANEAFGFPELRALANIELVRMAIETRKDQIANVGWSVRAKGAKRHSKQDPRAADVEAFFKKPDGVHRFSNWVRMLAEDLLVIDAPTLERRKTFGGAVSGYDIVPGDTIKCLVDATGRRPAAPDPAYQQIIKGTIWAEFSSEELIYSPRNPRSNHLYGFSPVEQIVVTATTMMRRQTKQLAHFTEGNTPPGILNAPESWTPDQIKSWQQWFTDKLRGNDAARSQLLWVPGGTKYQAFADPPIKDEFDEWLARIVAYAFSLPPTPFIKQLNRSTAEESGDRALEEGLGPILKWFKELFDDIIQSDLGLPDLEWAWDRAQDQDPVKQSEIHDRYLKNGTLTIDDVLEDLGREPAPDGMGAVRRVLSGATWVAISDLEANAELSRKAQEKALTSPPPVAAASGQQPPQEAQDGKGGAPGGKGGQKAEAPAGDIGKAITGLFGKAASKDTPFDEKASTKKAVKDVAAVLTDAFGEAANTITAQIADILPENPSEAEILAAADRAAKIADLSAIVGVSNDVGAALATVATESVSTAIAQIGPDTVADLVDVVNPRAVKWSEDRAAEMVGMRRLKDGSLVVNPNADMAITDTTREAIRKIVADGLTENIGSDAIIENLIKAEAFSEQRAKMIALTEIANANSQASLMSYRAAREAGVSIKKKWLLGPKPCAVCKGNADDGAIEIDEPFASGDQCPSAHPGCMCAVSPVVEDE